jgi:endonuclease/exonuclease/phosphatase (EEP) superfamily protein YafD
MVPAPELLAPAAGPGGGHEPSAARGLAPSPVRDPIGRLSGFFTWSLALVVLFVLVLIRWVGDRWWGVAVALFVPRWLYLVPLPFLALASGLARRPKQWLLQGVLALVIAGPLMAVSLPIHQLWDRRVEGTRVRVMTLNRGTNVLDAKRLTEVIEQQEIDLICFQEFGDPNDTDVKAYLIEHGWYGDRGGFVASRYPIVAVMPPLRDEYDTDFRYSANVVRARIRTPGGLEFGLVSVHMPTLRYGFYRFLEQDIAGLKQHSAWWDRQAIRLLDGLAEMRDVPILIGGDFNLPPDHASMAALGSLFRFAFEDAGWGYGYTRPSRYPWFRIDHIMASPEWVFTRCWVGPDVGSDHLPLIAEAVLPASREAPEGPANRGASARE